MLIFRLRWKRDECKTCALGLVKVKVKVVQVGSREVCETRVRELMKFVKSSINPEMELYLCVRVREGEKCTIKESGE